MAHLELKLQLHIWGKYIDPEDITKRSHVTPTATFRLHERGKPNHYVFDKAGWEWACEWLETEEATWGRFLSELRLLKEIVPDLREQDDQLDIWVTMSGYNYYDLLTTTEQAKEKNIASYQLPSLSGQDIEVNVSSEAIQFLAEIGASFETYIPTLLEDDESAIIIPKLRGT